MHWFEELLGRSMNDLADTYCDIGELYENGYRCRYDPALLEQLPLPEGQNPIEKEMCFRCEYADRHGDPYCRLYLKSWGILSKIDSDRYGPNGTES